MNNRLKRICIYIGFLFIILISIENYFYVFQPINSIGAQITISEKGIVLNSIHKNGQAYNAGFRNGDIIGSINDKSAVYFDYISKTKKRDQFFQITTHFFEFDNDYIFRTFDDKEVTIHCEKGNVSQMFNGNSDLMRVKLIVAFLFFVAGIFCSFYYGGNKTSLHLIFFIYFTGLGVYNNFNYEFESMNVQIYEEILGDIGVIFGLFFLFKYIAHTFKAIGKYNGIVINMAVLNVMMVAGLVLKYLIYTITKCPIVGGFMRNYNAIWMLVSFVPILMSSIAMFINCPPQSTYIFRYVIIACISVWIPVTIILITMALDRSLFYTKTYYAILIGALACMPVVLMLSIVQSWGEKFNKWVRRYICWMYFCVFYAVFIFFFQDNHTLMDILIFLCPVFAFLFKNFIDRMLSAHYGRSAKQNEIYRLKVSEFDDLLPLLRYSIETIQPVTNSKFVYIQGFKDNKEFINYRSSYEIPKVVYDKIIEECNKKTRKGTYFNLSDGSFTIPYYVGDELILRFIIGPKVNYDEYIPGEQQGIIFFTDICFKQYLAIVNNAVSDALEKRNKKIINLQNHTIISMANLIESRDGGTGEHVKRTSLYSKLIAEKAKEMNVYSDEINADFISHLTQAAPLHDIGKIVVSDTILQKPGKLTEEEFEMMKKHTTEGGKIIQEILNDHEDKVYVKICYDVAMYHHEKWNGKGYPEGLKGTEIPLCARILALADVFDALVSPRCYKKPFPVDEAFKIMEEEGENHFDPELLKVFLASKEELLKIKDSTN